MNITLDDTSPQISYISATHGWLTNHTNDNIAPQYFDGTFHGTYTQDDMMTLTFNGTAVYIYGAKRGNHGLYTAQLDNGNVEYMYGYSATNEVQQLLYSSAGLSPNQEHTVSLISLPDETSPPGNATFNVWFDIDYAVITTATTGKVYTTTIDDSSPYISYSGLGWVGGQAVNGEYYNNTAHVTGHLGDSFSMDFNGSSVQVFGGLNTNHGNFTVALDGVQQGSSNGTFFTLQPRVSLFVANNLVEGSHNVVFTNFGLGSSAGPGGNYLDFDFAVVNTTVNPNAPATSNTTGTSSNSTSIASSATAIPYIKYKGGSSAGAIAGGVVGGVILLALIAILAYFLLRRRKNKREYTGGPAESTNLTGDEVKPYPNSSAQVAYAAAAESHGWGRTSGGVNSPSARESDQSNMPFLTLLPPPPASNATSYPRSVYPPSTADSPSPIENSEYVNPFTSSGGPRSLTQPGSTTTPSSGTGIATRYGSDSESPSPIPPRGPSKAAGVALPFTARPPAPSSATTTNSPASTQRRFQREGRDSDMGPAMHSEHAHGLNTALPPDYQQATGQSPPLTARSGSI